MHEMLTKRKPEVSHIVPLLLPRHLFIVVPNRLVISCSFQHSRCQFVWHFRCCCGRIPDLQYWLQQNRNDLGLIKVWIRQTTSHQLMHQEVQRFLALYQITGRLLVRDCMAQ